MKFSKLMVFVLVSILFYSGCGDDPFSVVLDVEPPEHVKQLAVHCYVSSNSEILYAGLSETRALLDNGQNLDVVSDGALSLYNDDTKLFDFVPNATSNSFVNYTYNNTTEFGTKEGVMELRASAPGYPELRATQTFPKFVPVTDVKFEEEGTIDIDGSKLDAVEITFTDPAGEENYYEIGLVRVDSSASGNLCIGRMSVETQDLNAERGGDWDAILLTDAGFDGQEYKIILGIYNSFNQGGNITLQWKCISKEHYQYSKSLRAFNDSGDLGGFAEPVSIFSNVENGLGVFTCSTDELYTVVTSSIVANPNVVTGIFDGRVFRPCEINASLGDFNNSFSLSAYDSENSLNLSISSLEIGMVGEENNNVFQLNYYTEIGFGSYRAVATEGLEITAHDEDTNFVSGTFSGTLESYNTGNTIEVEDLIFEVFYQE